MSRTRQALSRLTGEQAREAENLPEARGRLEAALRDLSPEFTTRPLNDHVVALLAALPEPLGDEFLEICSRQHIQPVHLMLGHILKADQRAELAAPILLPEWTERTDTSAGTGTPVCRACGKTIHNGRPGQVYCCNICGSGKYPTLQQHSEGCQYYIKPVSVLHRDRFLPNVPPEEAEKRMAWEREMFARRLQEVAAAEQATPGLGPPPDLMADARESWVAKNEQ